MERLKRWWAFALVITLALSLTSCAKRSYQGSIDYGFGYCDGQQGTSIGNYDVYVIPLDNGLYQLSIIPIQPDADGDVVRISLANNNLNYKLQVQEVVVYQNSEINAGTLTDADLNQFNELVITSFDPANSNAPLYQQNPQKQNVCGLPLPGNQSTYQGQ